MSNPWKDRQLNDEDNHEPMVEPEEKQQTGDPDIENELEEDITDIEQEEEEEVTDNADSEHHKKLAEAHDHLMRAKAEVDNVRRRAEQDVSRAHKYANEKIIKELIPILDSLEQALSNEDPAQAMREGVELTHKMLLDTLKKFGVDVIDPVGAKFDPQHHEAMAMQPSKEHEANTVITVFQKGYSLNGRLVRPARVVVAKSE